MRINSVIIIVKSGQNLFIRSVTGSYAFSHLIFLSHVTGVRFVEKSFWGTIFHILVIEDNMWMTEIKFVCNEFCDPKP